MLLSAGERIAMALLSMAIRELGGDAISFTGSQSGIITNDRHIDARIIEVRPFRVQDELARGRVVVVAGYQGVSYRREVTTWAAAAATRPPWRWPRRSAPSTARSARTWTASIPPTRGSCPDARRIPTLSYDETQELAESGAKVLNAQAVEFAKDRPASRSTRARRRRRCPGPDPSSDGTVVRKRRRRGCPAPSSAWPASATSSCCTPPATGCGWWSCSTHAGSSASSSSGPAFGAQTDAVSIVVSRENLHDEARLRE
jgi:aspartate kinase